jgi:Family of unknown function (DUF5677)
MSSESRVDIGYPEFRAQVYSKYAPAIRAAQDLVELAGRVSESKEQILAGYQRVSSTGRFKNKQGKDRNRWSNVPLFRMAEEVGLRDLYLTFYSRASSMQHLDLGGLSMQTETSPTEAGDAELFCDVSPSEKWIEQALVISHGSVLKALVDYNELARLPIDSELETAHTEFFAAWQRQNSSPSPAPLAD